jgi:hypothetical protein
MTGLALLPAETEAGDFLEAAFAAPPITHPFRHWLLDHVLPPDMAHRLAALDLPGNAIGETQGRRETNNAARVFIDAEAQSADADCRALAACLQSQPIVQMLAKRTGADLDGTFLRIEYCRDAEGFWLEPHTDIGAKHFTLLIYLNTSPDGEAWGTDLFDSQQNYLGTAPAYANSGLAFVPGPETWHGYRRRPMTGLRRTLIVNYVCPEWRSVHELAFPGEPVRV